MTRSELLDQDILQRKAARAMLAALRDARAHIGRTDLAWSQMSARERVANEDMIRGRLASVIAQAEAAGIK